jgi:hypothetical protein
MLYKKVKRVTIFQKMQQVLPIQKNFFVYMPSYVACLLARSGWNWFSWVDGGVLIGWSHGK